MLIKNEFLSLLCFLSSTNFLFEFRLNILAVLNFRSPKSVLLLLSTWRSLSGTLTVGQSITSWLASSFLKMDSTALLHTNNKIFYFLDKSNLVKRETSHTGILLKWWVFSSDSVNSTLANDLGEMSWLFESSWWRCRLNGGKPCDKYVIEEREREKSPLKRRLTFQSN